MANNKTCITCGKTYKYCPSCGTDRDKPMWMNIYCSDNCRILFNTATNYFGGDITKEQAKEIVDKADLSKIDRIRPDIVKMIKEVQMFKNSSFEKSLKPNVLIASTFNSKEKDIDTIKETLDKKSKRSFKPNKNIEKD